jgi:predicted anti-sigma-YlaC factor YlaD
MTAIAWHPDDPALQDYVDGRTDLVSSASVEAHLLACATCRAAVAAAVPDLRLGEVLAAVEDRLDQLDRPRLERWARRLGVAEVDARALLAAPSMRLAWFGAVVGSVTMALLVAGSDSGQDSLFLLLAPMLPALATAAAYAPGLDPAHGIAAATPYSTMRMLLLRSLAVGTTALLGTGLAALALPGHDRTAWAWLLPSLALTLLVLALSRRFGTSASALVVAGGWFWLVIGLHTRGVEPGTALGTTGQLLSAALAALALTALVEGRHQQGGAR